MNYCGCRSDSCIELICPFKNTNIWFFKKYMRYLSSSFKPLIYNDHMTNLVIFTRINFNFSSLLNI